MPRTNRPYTTKRSSALARLRVRAKLTPADAAAAIGISVSGLSNIERGTRASDEVLAGLARAYGIGILAVRRAYLSGRRIFIAREGV